MNYYDDWVYIGKETYGSRHTTSRTLKPGTKFFDVLGRMYDKMKARIAYYVFKDAIEKSERDVALEFDMWARIVKDSEGNDIQVFIKEDKANGLRRDSSFYWDGSWEVFEKKPSGVARLRASDGTVSWSRYDDKNRLTESYLLNKKGDTLISEQYEWKNGRLAKTIIDGVTRSYIYGKTLRDTVRVIPSDNWIRDYYNSGYNGTAGKIPEEGTPEYGIFARWPYRYALSEKSSGTYFAVKNSTGSLNVLQKRFDYSGSCVDKQPSISDTVRIVCIRDERNEIPDNDSTRRQGYYGWPGKERLLSYGASDAQFHLTFECKCNAFGKYQAYFSGSTVNEIIAIKQSTWRYYNEGQYWQERCWYKGDLNNTYEHEVAHIKNCREKADRIAKSAIAITYDAIEKCREQASKEHTWLENKWKLWYEKEQNHGNPNSPTYGGLRLVDKPCN